jgi:NADPH-dependent 2,4-dienoyl-CoA reductase/sulfur reductase-like enzyme
MSNHVIIIGASIAGVGAATELRECGYDGGITLIDAQAHLPYDRPALSKSFLIGESKYETVRFHDEDEYRKLDIDLRLGIAVTRVDGQKRTVVLDNGETLNGSHLIIATGARARPFPDAPEGVLTIRELSDALSLKNALETARHIAVIGGGFIGAEVASSARKLGLAATIYEADALPFIRILGQDVAQRLATLHRSAGVTLKTGVRVKGVWKTQGEPFQVSLSDGATDTADIVVAGLGALPNAEFLAGSGIEVADGILCDSFGRTSCPNVYAAGDVANWSGAQGVRGKRDEHWTSAREQARIVAHHIADHVYARWDEYVPYFWSDMHGKRIQALGCPQHADECRFVHDDPEKGAFLAEYRCKGVLVGVAGCNAAVKLMKYRQVLLDNTSLAATA